MLSTTLSKDLYKRHINPQASDQQLLRVARATAVGGGALGVVLSVYLSTVVQALTIFYSLLGVTLFVPVLGGLWTQRSGEPEALSAIATGVVTLFVVAFALPARPSWLDPNLTGIVAAAIAYVAVMAFRRTPAYV